MIKHTWLTATTTSCQQIQDTKNYLTTARLNKNLAMLLFTKCTPNIRTLKRHTEYKSTLYCT